MKISYYSLVLFCSLALWGCSNSNSSAPAVIDATTGKHAAGWAANGSGGAHPLAYFDNPGGCQDCHGVDLKGGISKVSCSNPGRSGVNCHATFPHIPGFAAYDQHGNSAKAAVGPFTGMAHCQKCHGVAYAGKSPAPSCIACHKRANSANDAPHAANWASGNVNGLRHSTTDASNAPACYQCHAGGKYSHPAPSPAPAGTAPGCFNGTMCHNTPVGHTFTTFMNHTSWARDNLAYCQPCHATPSSGTNPRFTVPRSTQLTPNGCENCHSQPGIAHPYMWLPGRGGSLNTNHKNAKNMLASCGMCHGLNTLSGGSVAYPGGRVAPSCFPASSIDGAGCHITVPVSLNTGLTVGCVSCHGYPPDGTAFPNEAFRHGKHWALPGLANNSACDSCHKGYGLGTPSHANGIMEPSVFPKIFWGVSSSTTPAEYNTTTEQCTNISCHGSQVFTNTATGWTATWTNTEPVLVPNDPSTCLRCHRMTNNAAVFAAPYPYIWPSSGNNITSTVAGINLHYAHFAGYPGFFGYTCLDCHNLSVHFTRIMQGSRDIKLEHDLTAPSVGGPGTKVASYTYTNPTLSSCTPAAGFGCHPNAALGFTRSWFK